jgi:poly(A) polymerase
MLVKTFVQEVYLQQGYPEAMAKDAGGKIFTFGSYRLGVHSAGKNQFIH